MPAVIALISGAATTTAVAGLVVGGVTIGAVGAAVIGAVVSGIVGSVLISKPSVGNFNAMDANVLINRRTANAPIPVVYGTRKVGGTIVFINTQPNGLRIFINLVVSEGEIENFLEVYFDDIPFTDSKFQDDETGSARYARHWGATTQQGDATTANQFSYYSTSEHRLAGTAYLALRLRFNPELFPSGIPVVTTLIKGVKVYDPRSETTAWSENPVLCLRDYLTNTRYGRGIDPSLIDDVSFNLAANYCDEEVAYNGTDSIKRYTCNGVVETQNSSLNIIKQLLSSCRGILIFSGGLYKIIIDKPEMAVFTFSEDNIIGGWTIKLGSKNSQFNRMRANFFNANKHYSADIAIVNSEQLREQDGGLLERMIDLPFTSDLIRAKAITVINLNQSRHPITCEFTSTIEGLRVEVGDVVYIKHKTPGWDTHNANKGKKFRIMRVTLQNNDEVRIMANEYADEVYDLSAVTSLFDPTEIGMNDLSICLPPSNLSSAGSHRDNKWYHIEMEWTASPDAFIISYEVGYRNHKQENWTQINVGDSLTYHETLTRNTSFIYYFRVRAINIAGTKSEWLE
jgi:predicted phage tail protein